MKKIISLMLAILITLGITLTLVSCTKDDPDTQDDSSNKDNGNGDSDDNKDDGTPDGGEEDKDETLDYMKEDLSQFLTVSGYKDFLAEVNTDPIEQIDVEQAILKDLYSKRSLQSTNAGDDYIITAGDVVSIFYRGYTLESGRKVEFDGGCNFMGSLYDLGIGSGSFIVGFELELIGKKPSEHSSLVIDTSRGEIGKDDKIFIVYTVTSGDAVSEKATAIVNLSLGENEIDSVWGDGFYEIFTVATFKYGTEYQTVVKKNGNDETVTFTAFSIVSERQLVSVTYSATMPDGEVIKSKTEMIDLSDPTLDERYGEGFREFLLSDRPIGTKLVDEKNSSITFTAKTEKGEATYYDIGINGAFEVGDDPITVEVYFPTDYNTEALRGKKVYFDVYVQFAKVYDAGYASPADIDDAFITDVLGLSEDSLKDYKGDTLVEKYRARILAGLTDTYNEAVKNEVVNLLLAHYVSCAEVIKLPESEVNAYYDSYEATLKQQHAYYASIYPSFDDFARLYLGLSAGADWKAELKKIAEKSVTQQLVFYYVMRAENAYPSEEEMPALYEAFIDELLVSYLSYVGCTPDKYETEEAYNKAVAEHRAKLSGDYTIDYLRENIIFEYAFDVLTGPDYVTVKAPFDKYAD